jgi:hypothetical protein
MGNANKRDKSLFEDFSFFTLSKLEGKANEKVLYIFTDPFQYPESGLIVITKQGKIDII